MTTAHKRAGIRQEQTLLLLKVFQLLTCRVRAMLTSMQRERLQQPPKLEGVL